MKKILLAMFVCGFFVPALASASLYKYASSTGNCGSDAGVVEYADGANSFSWCESVGGKCFVLVKNNSGHFLLHSSMNGSAVQYDTVLSLNDDTLMFNPITISVKEGKKWQQLCEGRIIFKKSS